MHTLTLDKKKKWDLKCVISNFSLYPLKVYNKVERESRIIVFLYERIL